MGTPDDRPLAQLRQTAGSTPPVAAGDGGVFSRVRAGERPPVRSLYIHVPFCVHKCHYCDFYSIVDTQDRMDVFGDRLIEELKALSPHAAGAAVRTVFVGGGTPSLLGPERWKRLLGAMHEWFDLSLMKHDPAGSGIPEGEFTIECNPESATPELFDVFVEGGVNRVSIGAQSFHEQHLKTLERQHNPENVFRAIHAARTAGIPRQSLDLIYAIPGQTLDESMADLATGLGAGTTHVSCYNLTYEPNTAMTKRLSLGEFTPIAEETEIEMFTRTRETFRGHGFEAYEVSNFAKVEGAGNKTNGRESERPAPHRASGTERSDLHSTTSRNACRHNLAYWRQEQWLAAGPSASGHLFASHDPREGGWRWKNTPRLGDYLAGEVRERTPWHSPTAEVEPPDAARAVRERLMTGLRLSEGIDRAEAMRDAESASPGAEARLGKRAAPYEERGLLVTRAGRWMLTEEAMLRADGIAADLMRAV